MVKQLLEPVFDRGLLESNFFNGGVLTAEMLQTEQAANRSRHRQLGMAIGAGVVAGYDLRVVNNSPSAPHIEVSAGLALSHCGQLVILPDTVTVALAREPATFDPEAGVFTDCEIGPPAFSLAVEGVFVLTALAVSGFKGRAPMHGFQPCEGIVGCGSRYIVHGVAFRLVPYPASGLASGSGPVLRSRIAFGAFGVDTLAALGNDPFGQPPTYGALDAMRATSDLTDCDVPLAIVRWTAAGIEFIDPWSVRRPVVSPVMGTPFPFHTEQRRLAESYAIFLQFQDSVMDLLDDATTLPIGYAAAARFRFLPPAGYLPTGPAGFNPNQFFAGFTHERITADPAYLRLLVQQSFFMEPIDLASGAARPPLLLYESSGDIDWVLFVRADRSAFRLTAPPDEPPAEAGDGDIEITLTLADGGAALNRGEVSVGKASSGAARLRVWAEDEAGNRFDAEPVKIRPGSSLTDVRGDLEFDRGAQARFRILDLRPGRYRVNVRLVNYHEADRQVRLEASESVNIALKLVPESDGGRTPIPRGGGDVTWFGDGWYAKLYIIEELLDYPWPPERVPPRDLVFDAPPEDRLGWFLTIGDRLRERYPDAPVDFGDIKVAVDSIYTPDEIADEPYAYLIFGDGGMYVPAVLTPIDRSFAHDVPIERGGLSAVDRGLELQFHTAGLGRLDALGAAWTGLISQLSGLSDAAAREIVGESREAIAGISGTLREYGGMTAEVETALTDAGIDSPIRLANETPDRLVELGIERGRAIRLVDEARASLPRDAWSTETLGLSRRQISALNRRGIDTLGLFSEVPEDEREQLAADIGIQVDELDTLIESINLASLSTNLENERIESAPVVRVVGVNRDVADTLTRANIRKVGDLRGADVDALTRALGDRALAERLINAADQFGRRR